MSTIHTTARQLSLLALLLILQAAHLAYCQDSNANLVLSCRGKCPELGSQGLSAAAAAQEQLVYNIIFDAGSTGTRIHIFAYKQDSTTGYVLQYEQYTKVSPGLSSYAGNPVAAADSLRPLLAKAMEVIPVDQQNSTSAALHATAGLRLLPGTQAEEILAAVRTLLATYPFNIAPADKTVNILSGEEEGAFMFLAVNYLLGKLDKTANPMTTVSTLDMGGGSLQETFALSKAQMLAAKPNYTMPLNLGAAAYNVYVHSYLGWGQKAARAQVIKSALGTACFAKGSDIKYNYAGVNYSTGLVRVPGNFPRCNAAIAKAMGVRKPCGAPLAQCSFDGAWLGRAPSPFLRSYYAASSFWYMAKDTGMVKNKNATQWNAIPVNYATIARQACGKDVTALAAAFPGVIPSELPYLCLDMTYIYAVLTQGFQLAPNAPLTLVSEITFNGVSMEAAWALGASLNRLYN